RSHEHADFLKTPALKRADEASSGAPTTDPETQPADGHDPNFSLDFLAPSEKPGSLGRLGHYEVHEVIGRGGMGIVLRAFDEQLHRVVAVKLLAPGTP